MNHLNQGKYCGLDLSEEIIDFGRRECEALIAEKSPTIGAFGHTLDKVISLKPDLIFAFNVACHVHPEEIDDFFNNIKMLCAKLGSIAIIHVLTHEYADVLDLRYQRSGWAWPLEFVRDAMKPLKTSNEIHFGGFKKGPHELNSYYFVVQRG